MTSHPAHSPTRAPDPCPNGSSSPTAGTNGRIYCLPKVTEPPRGFLEQTCSGTSVFLKRAEDCDVSYGAVENTVCPVGKRIFVTGKKWPRVYEIKTK